MTGTITVRQGERVAVWDKQGRVHFVQGPKRMWLWDQTVQRLTRYSAGANEYLVIDFLDGRSDHVSGPASVWLDPVAHKSIRVLEALPVDAHEAVVVYSRQDGHVERRVVRGPAMFVPTEKEWLHEFCWHGADPKNPDRKIPYALKFQKLRVIPDQMYFNVEEVRTADDALLTVKLMIFFELSDIEVMLEQTHDPIADFVNAVSADVIDFVSGLTFERFKERTEALNDLGTYKQLVSRAERIGYRVNKVVYRGYHANANLQAMHDKAIEARTKLRLDAETERQEQELADMRLEREAQRSAQKQEMEKLEAAHRNLLKQREHDEAMRQMRVETEAELEGQGRKNELAAEKQRTMNTERAAHLAKMKEMEVDLTRYLVAQYQNPDRVIRVEDGKGKSQLHLHEN